MVNGGGIMNYYLVVYQETCQSPLLYTLQNGMDARFVKLHFEPHDCKKDLADRHGWLNITVCAPDLGSLWMLHAFYC